MRILTMFAVCLAMAGSPGTAGSHEMPEIPVPTEHHEWLQRFVGEWESQVEIYMSPDAPPVSITVRESFRPLGGFWVVGQIESQSADMPFSGVYTIGYNAEQEKYVGVWVESMTSHLAKYEGTIDPSGRILTMEAEGPCPMRPGERARFREVTEFRDPNHRVITSSIRFEGGEWIDNVKIDSKRQ